MSDASTKDLARPICPFCQKQYSRHDAVRRHAATCRKNTLRTPLPRGVRGRGPRACDLCAQRGVYCDKKYPCGRCSSRGVSCLYTRSRVATNHLGTSLPTNDLGPASANDGRSNLSKAELSFLLNLTDPSFESVTDILAVKVAEAEDEHLEHYGPDHRVSVDSDVDGGTTRPSEQSLLLANDIISGFATDRLDNQCRSTNLDMRLDSLISQLSKCNKIMRNNNTDDEHVFDEDLARSTFTADKFVEFASSYFRVANHIVPLIHRPSFDPDKVSPTLLLAVFIAGAAFSPPWDHVVVARRFVGAAEKYVYQSLHDLLSRPPEDNRPAIETLQAALLIQMVQYQSNDTAVRRRMRILRHPSLVSALRMLDLPGLGGELPESLRWGDFVEREIRIRLVAWTFKYDCLQTMFFNVPPSMNLSDMAGGMICSEPLFEAESEAEFQGLLSVEPRRPYSLQQLVASFYDTPACGIRDTDIRHLDLLLIICALHQVHFFTRSSSLERVTRQAIRCATTRWKVVWDALDKTQRSGVQHLALLHRELHHRCIFPIYGAYEFWWLLVNKIKAVEAGGNDVQHLQNAPQAVTDSLEAIHAFILSHQDD